MRERKVAADAQTGVLDRFERALRQHSGNRLTLKLDHHIGANLNADKCFADVGNLPEHTARGHHFVAFGERAQHGPMLFRTLALRPQYKKVKHDKKQRKHHRQLPDRRLRRAGLRQRRRDEEI